MYVHAYTRLPDNPVSRFAGHVKVITAFCETFGIQNRKRQGFIKTAKQSWRASFSAPKDHINIITIRILICK